MTMTADQRADKLLDKVFHKPAPATPTPDGKPQEPASNLLRSLNRQRRRLDEMKKGL